MSLLIFICEDNSVQRALGEDIIVSHIARKDYDAKIALSTGCPSELLEYIHAHPQKSALYFLDIDLQHQLNGIDLAREIRAVDLTGRIVFVTTHAKLSYLTFQHRIEAMDYIIKDSRDDVVAQIQECIDVAYKRFQQSILEVEHFSVKSSMGFQKIPISDILYFEAHYVPHKIILHTSHRRVEFRGSLKEVAKVNPHFFACHKSYVVNSRNVVRLRRTGTTAEAELVNKAVIPIGKAKVAQLAALIKA